jgi:anti-anti-sigma regulatory factor
MAFRISSRRDESGTVVYIEGRLDAPAVADLVATCRAVGHPLRLDLSGLRSADADGVRALRALIDPATEISGMSPHVRNLVFEDGGENRN